MPRGSPHPTAVRLAFAQFVLLAVIGVYVPYWPLWLEDRGFDAAEISWLIAVPSLVRTFISPVIAHAVDRAKRKRTLVALTAASSLAIFPFIPRADGFVEILLLQILFYSAFSALLPLVDFFTFAAARTQGFAYGRIRLFGSAGYLLANVLTGRLLDHAAPAVLSTAMLSILAATVLATLMLPPPSSVPRSEHAPKLAGNRWAPLLALALVVGLIQGSHATYYVFATIHWKSLGISPSTIGWLLAVAVLAEIVLFVFGSQVVRRVGAPRMLVIAGLIAATRWAIHPSLEHPLALGMLQCLHAGTFALTHLATLDRLHEVAPPDRQATAQSVIFAVAGIIGAVLMRASGEAYARFGGSAYYGMTAVALAGVVIAVASRRRSRGSAPAAA